MMLYHAELIARVKMAQFGLRDWVFEWDGAKRRFGRCDFNHKRISLSRAMVELNSEEVVTNTILHEVAHALIGWEVGHGPAWKRVARAIGCTGERCYHDEAVRVEGRWQATCPGCGKVFHKYRRPRTPRCCKRCGPEQGKLAFSTK